MTWEQKLEALKAIGEVSLHMRKPGDWYVLHLGVEVKNGGLLSSGSGDGATPELAVLAKWHTVAEGQGPIPPTVVLNAYDEKKRREIQWNGFMWAEAARA